jgi:molybdenum cofactor cytidylyltransferase
MGVDKLALPWGAGSILSHVVQMVAQQVDRTLVVLGPRSANLASTIDPRAQTLLLPRQTPDMRATIVAGLEALVDEVDPNTGLLFLPADQPHLANDLIRQVVDTYRQQPGHLVVPVFGERRGHPIAIPLQVFRGISSLPVDRGLNHLVREHADRTILLPWTDAGLLDDIDEPGDYARLRSERKA